MGKVVTERGQEKSVSIPLAHSGEADSGTFLQAVETKLVGKGRPQLCSEGGI